MKFNTKRFALIAALLLLADRGLAGCTAAQAAETAQNVPAIYSPAPTAGNSYTDNTDGGHAILADAENAFYGNVTVTKTGSAEGDKAKQTSTVKTPQSLLKAARYSPCVRFPLQPTARTQMPFSAMARAPLSMLPTPPSRPPATAPAGS